MATTIQIKRSSTASAVPLAGDLEVGELAVNLADKRLFTKKSDGTVVELSTNPTDIDIATLRIDGVEVTASAAELNSLDGSTASTADLNKLAAVTATSTELNVLDGFTGSTAELNILDGVTATTAELNILDGLTATTAELNYVDGVTSNIQTQLNSKASATASPTLTLNGDVSGSATMTNLGNATLTVTVADDSHNHTIANVDGLQTALDGKATTAQGALADSAVQPNDNVSFGTGDFSGNVDVTGTVTADGLNGTLNSFSTASSNVITANNNFRVDIDAGNTSSSREFAVTHDGGTKTLFNVNETGDVSFYEDTGTTAKMVWDASAESLILKGNDLDLNNGTALHRITNDNTNLLIRADYGNTNANSTIQFSVDGSERMRIDSSGNVGIGRTSMDERLHIQDGNSAINFKASNASGGYATFGLDSAATSDARVTWTNSLIFGASGSERARIDSSGNLLVGTTSNPSSSVFGSRLNPQGAVECSRDGNISALFNRSNSNGEIVRLQKDGSTVGSIGTRIGDMVIGTGDVAVRFSDGGNSILPADSLTGDVDDTISLGSTGSRFKDLYLSGGVYLGGTGSANKLDDYEEGTWTPYFFTDTGGEWAGKTTNSATYTRIGNVVHITGVVTYTSKASGAANTVRIRNIPFTGNPNNSGIADVGYGNIVPDSGDYKLRLSGTDLLFYSAGALQGTSLIVSMPSSGTYQINFSFIV